MKLADALVANVARDAFADWLERRGHVAAAQDLRLLTPGALMGVVIGRRV